MCIAIQRPDVRKQLFVVGAVRRLINEVALFVFMVIDQRRWAAHRECCRQDWITLKFEPWFDLLRQLISQVKKPAACERQITPGRILSFGLPSLVERIEKTLAGTRNKRLTWKSEKNVVTPKLAARRRTL